MAAMRYESSTTGTGEQNHAMTPEAAERVRTYGMPHTASAMCGVNAQPTGGEFRSESVYACGNCKRAIAASAVTA